MHERTGCGVCETELDCVDACDTVCCNCDWHVQTRHLNQYKIEINMRRKTCAENSRKFPDKKVCLLLSPYLCFISLLYLDLYVLGMMH